MQQQRRHARSISHLPKRKKELRLSTSFTPLSPRSSSPRSVWVEDRSYNSCLGCLRKFTIFLRRHHCRLCGHLFCSSCSSKRLQIGSSLDAPFVRVCESCYQANSLKSSTSMLEPTKKHEIALPRSIFSIHNGQIALSLSLNSAEPLFIIESLSPSLSCRCWTQSQTQTLTKSFQSILFFTKNPLPLRLRLDFPFLAPAGAFVGFSVNARSRSDWFVGSGHALIRSIGSSIKCIEELQISCVSVKGTGELKIVGSMAWETPERHSTSGDENTLICTEKRKEIGLRVAIEIEKCRIDLEDLKKDENASRKDLDDLSKQKSSENSETSLERRQSVHWEAVKNIIGKRNQLQAFMEDLRELSQALEIIDQQTEMKELYSSALMCSKCLGTVRL